MDGHAQKCKQCGEAKSIIFESGKCMDCAVVRVVQANRQLRARRGSIYNKWKKNLRASLRKM